MKKARVIAAMLLAVLLAFPGMMAVQAAEWNSGFNKYAETKYNIVKGVTETTTYMRNDDDDNVIAHTATIQANGDTTFKASYGKYYSKGSTKASRKAKASNWSDNDWNMMTTTDQAAAYQAAGETEGSVVLAVNGDYYNMSNGCPLGSVICEGNADLHPDNQEPYFAVLKDGSFVIRDADVPKTDVEEAICGPFRLIKDGRITEELFYGDAAAMPRHSIGIKENGDVVICEIDGRQEKSVGATVYQIAKYLKDQGCVDAIYLDGGGSATFATKREGTDKLKIQNSPSDGSERTVSSALLLVYKGNSDGKFDHASVTPVNEVYTPGSEVQFKAIGVDKSGGAATLPEDATWQLAENSKQYGAIDEKTGKFTDNGEVAEEHTVKAEVVSGGKVVGDASIIIATPDEFKFTNESINLDYEAKSNLGISVYSQGRDLNYKLGDLVWNVADETAGKMDGNTFVAAADNATHDLSVQTKITVKSKWNENVKGEITVGIGMKPVVVMDGGDNDGLTYGNIPIAMANPSGGTVVKYEEGETSKSNLLALHYAEVDNAGNFISSRMAKVSAEQIGEDTGKVRFGKHALKLNYDFSNITSTEGACIGFSKDTVIPGTPTAIGVWVYAPEGTPNLWLRLRCRPGDKTGGGKDNGTINLNFTEEDKTAATTDGTKGGINWTGWKYLTCDLTSVKAPITLPAGETFRVMCLASKEGMGTWVCTKDDSGKVSEPKYVGHTNSKGYLYIDNLQFIYGNDSADTDNPMITSVKGGSGSLEEISSDGKTVFDSNKLNFDIRFDDVQNKHTSSVDVAYVYVDGKNMEENSGYHCELNDGMIQLNELQLANGTHSLKVLVRDKNGNEATVTRTFEVKGDNKGLTSISLDKDGDEAYLGTSYNLKLTSNKLEDVKEVAATIKVNKETPVEYVTFEDAYKDSTWSYNEEKEQLTIKATRKDDATASGKGTIAQIKIKVPGTLGTTSYVTYKVEEGTVTYVEAKDSSVINTFATSSTSVPVKAAYTVKPETIIVGRQSGQITVKDKDGNPAADVEVYQVVEDVEDTLLGTTDEKGIVSTGAFCKAVQKFTVYAKGKEGYSFRVNGQSVKAQGDESGKPYNLIATATTDPATEKAFSWMTYPEEADKKAVVQYAKKTEYDEKKESAFQNFNGKVKLVDYTGSKVDDNYANYVNTVTVTGLEAGTEYAYRVGDGTNWSDVSTFKTKKAKENTKFFIIGDTQAEGEDLTRLDAIANKVSAGYDFGIQVGDSLESPGVYSGWKDILNAFTRFKSTDIVHVIGNHETYNRDDNAEHANTIYNTPSDKYYSMTYGNVYVATIAYSLNNAQMKEAAEWLAKDAAASDAQWKILTMHQPPYYTNPQGSSEYINEVIPPAVDKGGIDFVFSGHDHSFARTFPLTDRKVASDAKEDKDETTYAGKGAVYYICGSTGEKSYGVTDNKDFHFAKASQDYQNGIYLSVDATEDKCVVTAYDGDTVYDEFTKVNGCYNKDTKKFEHEFTTYSNGMVICEKCGVRENVETEKFSGLVKDEESGKSMFFVDGKAQTGLVAYAEDSMYFDENGLAVTGTLKIGDVEYNFEDGVYKSCSDKDATEVEFGYCGNKTNDVNGKNLMYAYHKGSEVLNIAKNPDMKDASGEMNDWAAIRDIPWQTHQYTIKTVKIGEGITNVGNTFIRTNLNPAAAQLKDLDPELTTVELPSTLEKIGTAAFYHATKLNKVTIPESVTYIGKQAFAYCKSLDITMSGTKVPEVASDAFAKCGKKSVLSVPNTAAWRDAISSKKIVFPGTIKYIGQDGTIEKEDKPAEDDTDNTNSTTATKPGTTETKPEVVPAVSKNALYAKVKVDNKKLYLSWNKISGVSGYDIYVSKCGKKAGKLISAKNLKKSVTTGKNTTITIKKAIGKKNIKKQLTYKAVVKAYQLRAGKKVYVKTSEQMHFVLKTNKTYTNPKSVQISKTTLKLRKGKKATVKALAVKEDKKKALLQNSHVRTIRWYSSDSRIVKVTSSGVIKAKKKGTCKVYAIGANGVKKIVTVVVK